MRLVEMRKYDVGVIWSTGEFFIMRYLPGTSPDKVLAGLKENSDLFKEVGATYIHEIKYIKEVK